MALLKLSLYTEDSHEDIEDNLPHPPTMIAVYTQLLNAQSPHFRDGS